MYDDALAACLHDVVVSRCLIVCLSAGKKRHSIMIPGTRNQSVGLWGSIHRGVPSIVGII